MRKIRRGTIYKQFSVATVTAMQPSISRLALRPTLTHSANVGHDDSRQMTAMLLLDHRPVIQIESPANVTGASGPGACIMQLVEVRGMPAVKRSRDIPPPSRWGINE